MLQQMLRIPFSSVSNKAEYIDVRAVDPKLASRIINPCVINKVSSLTALC